MNKTYKFVVEIDEWNDEAWEEFIASVDSQEERENLRRWLEDGLNDLFSGMVSSGNIRVSHEYTDKELIYHI